MTQVIINVYEDTSPLAKQNIDKLPDEALELTEKAFNAAIIDTDLLYEIKPDKPMPRISGFIVDELNPNDS